MTSDFSNELRQLAKVKYSAALLLGGATYGCLGVYIALLAIAMWSQRLSTGSLSSHSQKRIKWVLWVTATLIIIHHLSITFLIVEQVCEAGRLDGDPYYMDEGQGCLVASISFIVTPTFNTFTPPLIVLLSDGILAWRVYVIWDRRRWLKYALAVILFLNCVLGFTTAVFMSVHPSSLGTAVPLYQTWLWLSLVLNSAMTFSVLIRIRQVGNLSWRDLNRYATVVRALVESAIVSWLAILLCAIIWNQHEPDCEDWSCLPAVFNVESLDDNKARFALSELSALPILLGISQVLIVARVNISKLDVTRDLNNAISIIADHWDSPPEVANDIALEILPPRQHPSNLNQRVIHTGC